MCILILMFKIVGLFSIIDVINVYINIVFISIFYNISGYVIYWFIIFNCKYVMLISCEFMIKWKIVNDNIINMSKCLYKSKFIVFIIISVFYCLD